MSMRKILNTVVLGAILAFVPSVVLAQDASIDNQPATNDAASSAPSVSLDAAPRNVQERQAQYAIINKMSEEDRAQYFASRRSRQREATKKYFESLMPDQQKALLTRKGLNHIHHTDAPEPSN
jgi:16S rRNA G1207 methylase RsmC